MVTSPVPVPFIKRRSPRNLQDSTFVNIQLLDDIYKKTFTSYTIQETSDIKHRAYSKAFHTLDLVDDQSRRLLDLLANPIILSEKLVYNYRILSRDPLARELTTAYQGDHKISEGLRQTLELIESINHTASNRPAAQVRSLVNLDYQQIELDHRDSVGNYEESAEDVYAAMDEELATLAEQRQSITEMLEALGAEADDTYQGDELDQDGNVMSEEDFNDYQQEVDELIESLTSELEELDDYAAELEELIQAGRQAQASRASGGRSGGGGGSAGLASLFDMGGGGSFGGLDSGDGGGGGGGSPNETFITFFDKYMSDFALSFEEYYDAEANTDSKLGNFLRKQPRGEKGAITRGRSAKKSGTGAGLRNRRANTQQKTNKFIDDVGQYYSVREINVIKYFLLDGHISNTTWDITHSIAIAHMLTVVCEEQHEIVEYVNTIIHSLWVANNGSYEILERDYAQHIADSDRFHRDQQLLDRDTSYHLADSDRFHRDQQLLDRDTSYHTLDVSESFIVGNLQNRDTILSELILNHRAADYQVYTREVIPHPLITAAAGNYLVENRFTYFRNLTEYTLHNYQVLARDTTTLQLNQRDISTFSLLDRDTVDHQMPIVETSDRTLESRDTAAHSLGDMVASDRTLESRDTAKHEVSEVHDNQHLIYTREIIERVANQLSTQDLLLYVREQIDIALEQICIDDHAMLGRDTSNHEQTVAFQGSDRTLLDRNTSNHDQAEITEVSHEIYYSNHTLSEKILIDHDLVDHVVVGISEREQWLRPARMADERNTWLGRS